MSRQRWVRLVLLGSCLLGGGCLPNRMAVSPDGRTLYFALGENADSRLGKTSNVYALDVETGHVTALTGGPGIKAWCALSPSGRELLYSARGEESMWIEWIGLGRGRGAPIQTGVWYPWFVPGGPPQALAVELHPKGLQGRWCLLGAGTPKPLPLPDGWGAYPGEAAVALNRLAVPVCRPADLGARQGTEREVRVYVVDLGPPWLMPSGARQEPRAIQVAQWTAAAEESLLIDLAFSEDGRRLAAAQVGSLLPKGETHVLELDPAGKAEPKRLFADRRAFRPQWTPDGGGLVYLRVFGDDDDWYEVMLWRPDLKEPKVLARVAGEMNEVSTTWRWQKDGRLRVYHLSNDGVYVMETAADGSGAAGKFLSRDRLRVLALAADLERTTAQADDLSPARMPREDLPGELAGAVEAIRLAVTNASAAAEDAIRQARERAARWQAVPVVTELDVTEKGDAKPFRPPVLPE